MVSNGAWSAEAGKTRLGCLFTLLVVVAVVYYGFQYFEVRYRFYQMQDEVRNDATFAPTLSDEVIRRRLVVCDPARFGDDETAIYGLENGRILEQKIYGQQDLMHTAGECVIMQNRLGASHIVIETDGLGAGVEDRLREMGRKVIGVQMGAKALDPVRFKDRRSEVWWTAGEMIQAGTDCSIPNDPRLIGQLCTPKYEIVSKGVIKVERKEDIKERLIAQGGMGAGSPDRATAYVIGLAHLALCEPIDAEKPFRPALSVSQRYKPQAAQLAGTAMAA